jgi:hypothetical protein
MKKLVLAVPFALVFLLVSSSVRAGEPTAYGEPLGAGSVVALVELLSNPDAYVGRTVRVEGKITDVCPRRGCWVRIADKDGSNEIQFKVDDGVIEFPTEVQGRRVEAEGVFVKMVLTREQAIARAQHEAEEKGVGFDPATVTGPLTVYRLNGLGAVVR